MSKPLTGFLRQYPIATPFTVIGYQAAHPDFSPPAAEGQQAGSPKEL